MSESSRERAREVAEGFTDTASDYERAVRRNLEGVRRLVTVLPDGDYRDLLDVGCGTGWSALTFIARFAPERVIGVDPARGMLDVFRGHAEKLDGVEISLLEEEVMEMSVPSGSVDAVICTMALHWFADKAGAVREMADRLRPGGVLAILAGGQGTESEYRELMEGIRPPVPARWTTLYDTAPTSERRMHDFLDAAGLEALDVWMERRLRRTPVDEFLERMRVVASHLSADMDPGELSEHQNRIREAMLRQAGADGFEYHYCKLFAMARKPER